MGDSINFSALELLFKETTKSNQLESFFASDIPAPCDFWVTQGIWTQDGSEQCKIHISPYCCETHNPIQYINLDKWLLSDMLRQAAPQINTQLTASGQPTLDSQIVGVGITLYTSDAQCVKYRLINPKILIWLLQNVERRWEGPLSKTRLRTMPEIQIKEMKKLLKHLFDIAKSQPNISLFDPNPVPSAPPEPNPYAAPNPCAAPNPYNVSSTYFSTYSSSAQPTSLSAQVSSAAKTPGKPYSYNFDSTVPSVPNGQPIPSNGQDTPLVAGADSFVSPVPSVLHASNPYAAPNGQPTSLNGQSGWSGVTWINPYPNNPTVLPRPEFMAPLPQPLRVSPWTAVGPSYPSSSNQGLTPAGAPSFSSSDMEDLGNGCFWNKQTKTYLQQSIDSCTEYLFNASLVPGLWIWRTRYFNNALSPWKCGNRGNLYIFVDKGNLWQCNRTGQKLTKEQLLDQIKNNEDAVPREIIEKEIELNSKLQNGRCIIM